MKEGGVRIDTKDQRISACQIDKRMSTPATDLARWLISIVPRTTPRTQQEATLILTSVPKEQRLSLTAQQRIKLQAKCETPLEEPHFDFLTHDNSSDLSLLKSLYSVRMKVEELCQAVTADDMVRFFTVPSMMCPDPSGMYDYVPVAGSAPVDMFTSIEMLDLEHVMCWIAYLTAAGKHYLVKNLLWSATKIKGSLLESLRAKLIEKTIRWPVMHQTGVVYLKLIMHFIAESTPCSTRSLILKLQELSVCDYKGENICQVCLTIKGAYKVLVNKTAVPPDFLDLVFDVFDRCSVDKFVLHIRGIKTNHDQKFKIADLMYLLTKIEQKYQEIEDWNREKVESIFVSNDAGTVARQITMRKIFYFQISRMDAVEVAVVGVGPVEVGDMVEGREDKEVEEIITLTLAFDHQRKMRQEQGNSVMLSGIGAALVVVGLIIQLISTQN